MGTCHYCGAILEVGDRFCGNCGHPTTYVNNQMNLQYEGCHFDRLFATCTQI